MNLQENIYRLFGSIQPIIKFKLKNFDFGIVPFQSKKVVHNFKTKIIINKKIFCLNIKLFTFFLKIIEFYY